jgi:hypothetical protein
MGPGMNGVALLAAWRLARDYNAIPKKIVDAAFGIHTALGRGPGAAPIKDGILRIVNGLEEESHGRACASCSGR